MSQAPAPTPTFHHEALFYRGDEDFTASVLPFLREGVARDAPTLVAVGPERIRGLRSALGADADRVRFADMRELGVNPARIIPAWQAFVSENAGRPLRGIGEPIWPGRSDTEVVECHRHEALLNLAFADTPDFTLLCPYDVEGLPAHVVDEAEVTHPHLCSGGERCTSSSYRGLDAVSEPFDAPLPEPEHPVCELGFDLQSLCRVRKLVAELAATAGMAQDRIDDLKLAITEVASNSVRHGGGAGQLRAWQDSRAVVCEVRDQGSFADPLAGRRHPHAGQIGGYGLWLTNQVCTLVQVRQGAMGSVVRLHMPLA